MSTTSTNDKAGRRNSVKMLPPDSSVVFKESTYFSENGPNSSLPSPAIVRATHKARHLSISMTVRFEDLKLVVKYGREITIAEALCLWAIRRFYLTKYLFLKCMAGVKMVESFSYIWSLSKAKRLRTNGSRFRN